MSVDFYRCEICGDCKHEEYVHTVPTNTGEELEICEWCMKNMVSNNEIKIYNEDDLDETEPDDEQIAIKNDKDAVEAISYWGRYGIYSIEMLKDKIEDKKESIKKLNEEINKLEDMIDKLK